MKKTFFSIIFLFFIFSLNGQEGNIKDQNIQQLFAEKDELYFVFAVSDHIELNTLTKLISIDNVKGNLVFAYANQKEFIEFSFLGYSWKVLPSPGELYNPKMLSNINRKDIKAWNFYPTYDAYDSIMYQFEADFPSICETKNIGTLASGRKLLAVKISDNVGVRENEPQFLYTSTMHGDETVGYILMLRLIDYLLSNYGVDSRITKMLDNIEIWINPNANPDGTYKSGNHTVYGATRSNANGVDLNRNYPDPQDGPHPDGYPWQPETVHFMDFADTMDFVIAANIHSGAEVVNYPWDTWPQLHPDDDWWVGVSRDYADTAQFNSPSGYLNDQNNGITNGYAWYTINGGRADYMNYFEHCREFTLELSNVKILPEAELEAYWNYNYRALLNYMEQAMFGISGIIIDSCTSQPIKAKVFVNNHDFDESHVFSSLPLGNYYRPIYPGTYSLTFSAPGYQSKIYNNVFVVANDTTILNIVLQPIAPVADFLVNDTFSCTGLINFHDISQTQAGTIYEWNFGDGSFSNLQNPSHTYLNNGTYTVKLSLHTICSGSDSIVKTDLIVINKPLDPFASDVYNCGSDSVMLNASGTGLIEWYDDISGGSLLDTGEVFITPYLSASKTYYIQNVVQYPSQNVGKPDNSGGGGIYSNNSSHYLFFDCYQPITLISVKVYADGDAFRNIQLRDNSGSVIQSINAFIPDGESRLTLNFEIPVGMDFELAGPSAPYLYRNNNGVSYPYEIPGLISITHSSAGTGYYYYFYDWEIRKPGCVSNRVPVNVIINQGLPVADFSYSINFNTISFLNNSLDANDYLWDFGDGDTSTLQNPTHDFLFTGLYNIKLLVNNSCGSDSMITQILVSSLIEHDSAQSLQIFPNPCNGSFILRFNSKQNEEFYLTISNLIGETLIERSFKAEADENHKSFRLQNMKKGIYFVTIGSKNIYLSRKLVIQ
ncbi:MAG: PKD domain-containing protein [Bacteroidales bacterium]|nr:PKD domain-containing protein [Bacteroidales bacterium]